MDRKRVSASNIRAVGYDAARQLLEIEFSSGSVVQYSGVSPEVHRRFMGSPSPGSFYQDQIEENFPSKRLR
jgi:YD repeat-containing protein